ncbi:hypothetical protein NQ315_014810 [Exocentrus adspersus]|uniref:Tyr recombinase domain-containing protein n=1 Tax=Exocentrus adspersus TaxID=1586481 RepID=A0AAV8VLV6_9CUCU|nr:hypothetical protein NQ315_014810 [Exocentrus adspersus]
MNCSSENNEEIAQLVSEAESSLLPVKSRAKYEKVTNSFATGGTRKMCKEPQKKSSVLSMENVKNFLKKAADADFLFMKVVMIIALHGACRAEELRLLKVDDVEDSGRILTEACRPSSTIYYKSGKCTVQPVGINTFSIPKKIAAYLGLPEPNSFTGHCFRRTSATFLADSGADIQVLKRHSGWRSSGVAEAYVEDSIENKVNISKILFSNSTEGQPSASAPTTSTVSARLENRTALNPKKSKILTSKNINDFLEHAPDDKYLFMKVALIIGISGACRKQELRNIKTSDIQDTGKNLIINIPDSKTKR